MMYHEMAHLRSTCLEFVPDRIADSGDGQLNPTPIGHGIEQA